MSEALVRRPRILIRVAVALCALLVWADCTLAQAWCERVPVDSEVPAGFAGTYDVVGTTPQTGKPYAGTLTITAQDSVYRLVSRIRGRGVVRGEAFFQRCGPDRISSLFVQYKGAPPIGSACVVAADGDFYYRVSCRMTRKPDERPGIEAWVQVR